MRKYTGRFAFDRKYFLFATVLFLLEAGIALFVRDSIIRPYTGDFLVVIFLYCAIKSFWRIRVLQAAAITLVFSYQVELMQYAGLVNILDLQDSAIAVAILGNHFEWPDILLYSLGVVFIVLTEFFLLKEERKTSPQKGQVR